MKKISIALAATAVLMTGCKKKDPEYFGHADQFVTSLEGHYGDDFSIEKLDSEMYGYIVVKNETTGEFSAYNILKFDAKSNMSISSYLNNVGTNDVINDLEYHPPGVQLIYFTNLVDYDDYDYTYPDIYVDYYETYYTDRPPTDYGYDYEIHHDTAYFTGGGFTFEETRSSSKDLELTLGEDESANKKALTSFLTVSYGLSEDKSSNLAGIFVQYNKLINMRELSKEEKAQFEIDAFGVNMQEFEQAYVQSKKGNSTKLQDLVNRSAKHNNLSPEVVKDLIGKLF